MAESSPAPLPPPTPGTRVERVASTAFTPAAVDAQAVDEEAFSPLRVDPPPRLFATWWLRYVLFLTQLVALAVTLLTSYASGVAGVWTSPVVVVPHVMAAVMIVAWSALAMVDARRLVPATRYRRPARAWVATMLWLLALAAPIVALRVVQWARDDFADTETDDVLVVFATVAVVLVCFLLVWLPFRYHVRQAHRIGAPSRVVAAWFWAPLFAAVGGVAITGLGLHDLLADGGMSDLERTIQLGVLYGLPALVFALSTWRATTVFDEVIDLRWRRWRSEWEQTLDSMQAQPVPGPERTW